MTKRIPLLAIRLSSKLARVITGIINTAKALRTMETVVKGY